jgi:hypothetical protein
MSLLTAAAGPELGAAARLDAGTGTHTLTSAGGSWLLLTHHGATARPAWATPLARHGAGPQASQRVAQAVAVRVLHELGVDVRGWVPEPARPDGGAPDVVALTSPRPARLRAPRGH